MNTNRDVPIQNPESDTLTSHASSAEAKLREEDPELADEIYGTRPIPADAAPPADAPVVDLEQLDEAGNPVIVEPDAAAVAAAAAAATTPPAAGTTTPPAAGDGKAVMIPKARLDEALAQGDRWKELALAHQAATAAAGATTPPATTEPTPPAFDLAAKRREMAAAAWDGKDDEAAAIQKEIDDYFMDQSTQRALSVLRAEQTAEQARTQMLDVAGALIVEYPQLDKTKEGHNPDAIAAVQAERDVQIKAGQPPAVALRRAVTLVASEMGLTKATPAATTPPVDPRQRQVAQIAAGIATTPPVNAGGKGTSHLDSAPPGDDQEIGRDEWKNMSPAERDKKLGLV